MCFYAWFPVMWEPETGLCKMLRTDTEAQIADSVCVKISGLLQESQVQSLLQVSLIKVNNVEGNDDADGYVLVATRPSTAVAVRVRPTTTPVSA